jgi:alpha-amylase
MDFFLGNPAQQAVFQLMLHAYNSARLTGDERVLDLAEWLAQSDNLHLIQWFGRSGAEAEVSAYFTPQEWWSLGAERIVREIQAVYTNFVHALGAEPHRSRRTSVDPLEPEVAALTQTITGGLRGGARRA